MEALVIIAFLAVSTAFNRAHYGGKTVIRPGETATFDANTGKRLK
jgi:hypothetical protein